MVVRADEVVMATVEVDKKEEQDKEKPSWVKLSKDIPQKEKKLKESVTEQIETAVKRDLSVIRVGEKTRH